MAGTTRREFKEALLEIAHAFRQQIEAGVEGFAVDPLARASRLAQAHKSFRFFAQTYFPHYVTAEPSVLHEHMFQRLPELVASPIGAREYIVAPRGEAKTTMLQLFAVWCVATRQKHFIIMVADASSQADTMLEAIKAELEVNPRLAMDFPEICGKGPLWREGVIITASHVKLQAFGAGKRMRGVRHGPHRPDLALLDDIENDEQVRSPEQRDKRQKWLQASLLSLGAADDSMDVFYVGTILHYDSVLSRTVRNPLWHGRVFRAILRWPDDRELWDAWEALLLNEGEDAAQRFYAARRSEMDRGAVVSWPAVRPLYKLMLKRARDGHSAFDSEQQNDPSAGDAAPLASSIVQFGEPIICIRRGWINYGSVDPSLGRLGGGRDPSAVLVGAYSRELLQLQVLVASIKRRIPDKIISDVIDLQEDFRCLAWAVEAVQFQEFFRTTLIKQSLLRSIPVPARAVTPSTDKVLRIEAMQPYLARHIVIHKSLLTLIDQLKFFPMGDHDDGPDALEMLWTLASHGHGAIEFFSSADLDRDHSQARERNRPAHDQPGDDGTSWTRESW